MAKSNRKSRRALVETGEPRAELIGAPRIAPGELIVPALQATIGTWSYYAASLRFADVAARIRFADEVHGTGRQLNDLIQRSLEERAADIGTYLTKQEKERFLNALVVGVYEGDPQWFHATINANERIDITKVPDYGLHALGLLKFDGRERLFALDGQHRVEGIRQALRQDPTLENEQILVLFVGHKNTPAGLQRTRRLFTTLNRYAKPVAKSALIALDEDDAAAIVTRELVMKHPFLYERTSTNNLKSLSPADKTNVTTIGALYDSVSVYLRAHLGMKSSEWKEFKRFRPKDELIAELSQRAFKMWDRAADAVPSWRKVMGGPAGTAGELRKRQTGGDLWVRPLGMMMFADALVSLRAAGLTEPESIRRLAAGPSLLNESPWVGLLWDPANHRMITRAENRRVGTQILYYLCGGDLRDLRTTVTSLRAELEGLVSAVVSDQARLPRPHANTIPRR